MPPLEWLMLISHSAESRIAEEQMFGHVEKFQDRIAEMERLTLNEKKNIPSAGVLNKKEGNERSTTLASIYSPSQLCGERAIPFPNHAFLTTTDQIPSSQ